MTDKMPKTYNHKEVEPKVYSMWEEMGVFSPEKAQEIREKAGLGVRSEPFCVLIPPPNANAPLHCGHATYAIQDLMVRYKRMQGYKTLYFPGMDHAGFETQVVYERKLKEEGKSRFDFDRQTLYKDILNFVLENSDVAVSQLKRMGMSCDWDRSLFMLDNFVIKTVCETFKKMHDDRLVYRDDYLVNYSPHHGTTFSNLETEHKETASPLYYVKYTLVGENVSEEGFITVATVRPETIYADTAVAVNPKDSRYKSLIGKMVKNPLNGEHLKIIAEESVDMEFGTGALKITPGHDFKDFEIGRKHNLRMISVIGLDGKMVGLAKDVLGMTVSKAREKVVEILRKKNTLEKVDDKYTHNLLVDYKDQLPIEPMLLPNWFVRMSNDRINLAGKAIEAVERGAVKFNLPLWKEEILRWLKNICDWPISRQTVFGIRIPVWYKVGDKNFHIIFIDKNGASHEGSLSELGEQGFSLDDVKAGLQKIIAPKDAQYVISLTEPGEDFLPETDTFDTWFSSGQWPLTTLKYPDGKDFKTFYPTSFMDSMWDILFFWIARMIMFGLYLTDEVPFKFVYIHGRIDDEKGQKMSKSKGNVINPIDIVEKYGADALRMGILVGGNTAAKTTSFNEDKVRGYRNFANKIWNMARFILGEFENFNGEIPFYNDSMKTTKEDKEILEGLSKTIETVNKSLEKYRFADAGEAIYHFVWDELAAKYIESVKDREDKEIALGVLRYVFLNCLKLLHPFMPFITEEIWNVMLKKSKAPLIVSSWPEVE